MKILIRYCVSKSLNILPDPSNAITFKTEQSKFSLKVNGTVEKAKKELAGSYICKGELHKDQQPDIKKLIVTVHRESILTCFMFNICIEFDAK